MIEITGLNMILDKTYFIRDDFNYLEHTNYVFFDIDSTITSVIDERIRVVSDEYCFEYAKLMGFNPDEFEILSVFDFASLQKISIDLFAHFLRSTNSKAICISSWGSINGGQKFIDELEKAFGLLSVHFPEKWLIGQTNGCGGDRWVDYVQPFVEKLHPTCHYVVLDDGAHKYSNTENTVKPDPWLGFNIYDFKKALDILKPDIKTETIYDNDIDLSYYLKK